MSLNRRVVLLTLLTLSLTWMSVVKADDDDVVDAAADDADEGEVEGTEPVKLDSPMIENGVYVLNKDNFDEFVKAEAFTIVEFYAPWCGHCKRLAPEWESAASALASAPIPVKLAKVDADQEKELGTRFGVTGFPTLKALRHGEVDESVTDIPRESDAIVEFVKEKTDPDYKPPPSAVVDITESGFHDFINDNDLSLVEFFAPWCGHCKKLKPEYEKAARKLKELDPPVPLAIVDATKATELAKEYGVSGYPTLHVFRKGKKFEYKGGRDQMGIVSYMEAQRGAPSIEKPSARAIRDAFHETRPVLVGFFKDKEDPVFKTYIEAGHDMRDDWTMMHSFDSSVAASFGAVMGTVNLIHPEQLRSKFEPKMYSFSTGDSEALRKFIADHERPLVGVLDLESSNLAYKNVTHLCVVFYDVDFSHDHRVATQFWRQKVLNVAKKHKDVTFVIADESYQLFEEMGFGDSGEDVNVGCLRSKETKYPMDMEDGFDEDTFHEFIEKYKKDKVKPKYKSEKPPKNNSGPVKVVVASTFDDIVRDPTKDVLLEFYAPWCGHCKSLAPVYKKLGEKLRAEYPHVVVAKMDATANDKMPGYPVEGFPTIYYAPKDNKDAPISYSGDRSLEDLGKFVRDHSSVKVERDEL